jgi:methionyl-tRNA formyltransferase
MAVTCLCFVSRLIHKECLDTVFANSRITAVIVAGPKLTPLPFLADPGEHARKSRVPAFDWQDITPTRLEELAAKVDVGISLGYGKLLPPAVITAPRLGVFNLHPSALPLYRGKHPDLLAIMDGQDTAGITVHRMEKGIDTGPVVFQHRETIRPEDTIVSLSDRLYQQGARLLEGLLTGLGKGLSLKEIPQPAVVDALEVRRAIRWCDSAWRIHNLVRAMTYPWPMAKASFQGKPIYVSRTRVIRDGTIRPGLVLAVSDAGIQVGTGGDSIEVLELRNEQKAIVPLGEFAARFELVPGKSRFTDGA